MGQHLPACCSAGSRSLDYQDAPESARADTGHDPLTSLPSIVEQGAYLLFSRADQGTTVLKWSKEPVEGALAFFEPSPEKVSPASFKYKNGGQKEVLKSKLGISRKDYYKSWVLFVREGWKNNAVLTVLDSEKDEHLGVKLALQEKAQTGESYKVIHVDVGQRVSLAEMQAVAVAHRDATAFDVSTMGKATFVEAGNTHGAAETFQNVFFS